MPLPNIVCRLEGKKKAQLQSCELRFIWGQNGNYHAGDSFSGSADGVVVVYGCDVGVVMV